MDENQLATIVSVASAVAAWVAVTFAYWSARNSRQTLRLAEQQERRRRPALVLYLVDGYQRRHTTDGSRLYAFLISVSNQSDSDNAIARLDLRISYRTSGNFCAAVDVPASVGPEVAFGGRDQAKLQVPVRVDAHQTVTGWAHFEVASALLQNCSVDEYRVLVTDTHGECTPIDSAMIREFADEAETKVG